MTERVTRPLPHVETMEDLLTAACLVEEAAAECLQSLCEQMEVHHNPRMSALFTRLADMRASHAARILAEMEPHWRAQRYRRDPRWLADACPGVADMDEAHYLMQPAHGLQLAARSARRIHDFFSALAAAMPDAALEQRAVELKAQVAADLRAIEEELARAQSPREDWSHDDDPPVMQE